MTTPASALVFSAHAAEYTALRRRLVPRFELFYDAAVEALELPGAAPIRRVLDLGAGTGLLSACISARHPEARFALLDASAEMLAEAESRLSAVTEAVHIQTMSEPLPSGPFDAIVSALAIHHLEDAEKRALFIRVHDALRPGGLFVNAEQVLGPTPQLADLYRRRWAIDAAAQGASRAEIAEAEQRRTHDRCADVGSQLAWLAEAGFATADCTYKHWESAVLVAQKEV